MFFAWVQDCNGFCLVSEEIAGVREDLHLSHWCFCCRWIQFVKFQRSL